MVRYFEGSIFLRCLKKPIQVYLTLEDKISYIRLTSLSHLFVDMIAKLIKTGFKFSIFGRLTEKEDVSRNFWEGSRITQVVLEWIKNSKNRVTDSSTTSILFSSVESLKYTFFSRPLWAGSIIIITSIITNLTLSFILQKQIALQGWMIRGLLLFIGISGLFSNVNWQDLERTSLVLRKIK